MKDAACGCESAAETKVECDCQLQGECYCDANCTCKQSVCKSQVATFR